MKVLASALCALLIATTIGRTDETLPLDSAVWPDSFLSRLEALALLQTLNAALLSHDSATLTLDRWCEDHGLASPSRVIAERELGDDRAPTAEQRRILRVSDNELVRYRHVHLRCGTHVLSEADNWYVPARLTTDINRQLDTSDVAFGRAVAGLKFTRHTLAATLLWHPLPEGWETKHPAVMAAGGILAIPPAVLEHRAVLSLPDSTPFSLVVETYTRDVLDFTPPSP